MTISLLKTASFITMAHVSAVDKAGEPYYLHPIAVAEIVQTKFHGTEDEIHAALLHDIIEDTHYSKNHLLALGYSPTVIDILKWVSKNEIKADHEWSYLEWIYEIAHSGNDGAVKVKLADLYHNTDPTRGYIGTGSMIKRYESAISILEKVYYIEQ